MKESNVAWCSLCAGPRSGEEFIIHVGVGILDISDIYISSAPLPRKDFDICDLTIVQK